MKLTIIGNGFSKPIHGYTDEYKSVEIDRKIFYGMAVKDAEKRINELSLGSELTVLATSMAWIYHIPVSLYLGGIANLIRFYLPARYNLDAGRFEKDTYNQRHAQMESIVGSNTVSGLQRCMSKGWVSDEVFDGIRADELAHNVHELELTQRGCEASIIMNESALADKLAGCDAMLCYGFRRPSGFASLVWNRFHPPVTDKRKHFIDLRKMQVDLMHQMGLLRQNSVNYGNLRETAMYGGPRK